MLTLQAYRDLGGMEGALARRADEVFAGMPPTARSALGYVFRQWSPSAAMTVRPHPQTSDAGVV